MAKDAFRKADSDDRIKRALKSKGYKYHDEIYEPGEKIWFLKNNVWDKGTVTGMDGRAVIFDCKNEYGLKRPTCDVKKLVPESEKMEINEKVKQKMTKKRGL